MKRSLVILAVATTLGASSLTAHAADIGPLFTTPLLGIGIGTMAGFLASILTGDPGEHAGYIGIGAGIGFALGLALGVSEVERTSAGFYLREEGEESLYGFLMVIPIE